MTVKIKYLVKKDLEKKLFSLHPEYKHMEEKTPAVKGQTSSTDAIFLKLSNTLVSYCKDETKTLNNMISLMNTYKSAVSRIRHKSRVMQLNHTQNIAALNEWFVRALELGEESILRHCPDDICDAQTSLLDDASKLSSYIEDLSECLNTESAMDYTEFGEGSYLHEDTPDPVNSAADESVTNGPVTMEVPEEAIEGPENDLPNKKRKH